MKTKINRNKRRKQLVWVHIKSPVCEVYGWHKVATARKIIDLTLGIAEEHFATRLTGAANLRASNEAKGISVSGGTPNESTVTSEGGGE